MPDICDLILQQHHDMRQRFAGVDNYLAAEEIDEQALSENWRALRRLLDAHAEAEELLFYPMLLSIADDPQARNETRDAIEDHNKIRDIGRAAGSYVAASAEWWSSVLAVREHNSTHMAEEERGALHLARTSIDDEARLAAGSKWEAFMTGRLRELAELSHDKDPQGYVLTHGGDDA